MTATLTLWDYMKRVEREAGLSQSASFPINPTTAQQRVMDAINATLRELNQTYYLCFKLTSYQLTTTDGQAGYNLNHAPFNQQFYDITKIARHGVVRADGLPLAYIDYTERDALRPETTGTGLVTYYSAIGRDLLFWPKPNGEVLTIRYYGSHIGTDATGTVQKLSLNAATDLTMLEDQWQDALAYGAACKVRMVDKTDDKYKELKTVWEGWKTTLNGMSQPAGEDARPRLSIEGPDYADVVSRRYFPFGSGYEQ
jgi:hypothetical protein